MTRTVARLHRVTIAEISTRIGLSCRDSIDNVYYEYSFVKVNRFSKEIERFVISHRALMKALIIQMTVVWCVAQKSPRQSLLVTAEIVSQLLIHDLSSIAVTVLQEPCDEFYEIMRRGCRTYSVT